MNKPSLRASKSIETQAFCIIGQLVVELTRNGTPISDKVLIKNLLLLLETTKDGKKIREACRLLYSQPAK